MGRHERTHSSRQQSRVNRRHVYIETNLKVQCLVSVSKVLALVDQENTVQIMEVIECSKGGKKILLNGYMYTKKATKKNRIRWECSNRAAYDCKGAITTSHEVSHIFY